MRVSGEFTMLELAETVRALVNPSSTVILTPNTPDDPKQRKPDITKARTILRWEPKVREGGRNRSGGMGVAVCLLMVLRGGV